MGGSTQPVWTGKVGVVSGVQARVGDRGIERGTGGCSGRDDDHRLALRGSCQC